MMQPTPKQLAALEQSARAIRYKWSGEIGQIKSDLATNFEVPAQRSINAGFERMGLDRFTKSGDDLWEYLTATESDWEYRRPETHLVARWRNA